MEENKKIAKEHKEKTKMKFEEIYNIDVQDKVEQKNGLSYLSWAYAWAEVMKMDGEATYHLHRYGDKQLPYVYDENTGYMVETDVTIFGKNLEMWLHVMDGANMPMLDHDYDYETKKGMKTCKKATMGDINKTLMRCLTKNIAMFGLGLKLYQGEDLPPVATKEEAEKVIMPSGKYQGKTLKEIQETNPGYIEWLKINWKEENIRIACELLQPTPSDEEAQERLVLLNKLNNLITDNDVDIEQIKDGFKVKSTNQMSTEQLKKAIAIIEKVMK